ncbi:MAG: hypothetical protein WD673_11290 [Alphaproteobacteria bacterium]
MNAGVGPRVHAPFPDDAAVEDIVKGFLDRSLAKPRWNHHAHLVVSIWHVRRFGAERALDLLRDRIWSYNLAVGTQNTDTGGYHETITRFFIWRTQCFLASAPAESTFVDLVNALAASPEGAKDHPLAYWSRDRLMSVEARRGWVEPDLRPLA